MRQLYLLALPLYLLTSTASAQVLVQTRQPITYVPLPAATVLATTGDENEYTVTPPFSIQFYGSTFTAMTVSDNVAIAFPGALQVSLTNEVPGVATGLNGWIAPFWDDNAQYTVNAAYIGHQTQGTAPNRTFTVEWRNNSRYPTATASVFSTQVRFFEGQQRYEIDYGTIVGTAIFTATMGMEDATGANPFLFAPSGCTTSCSLADFTSVANSRVIVAQPNAPELTGSIGADWPRGAFAGQSANGSVVIRNLATQTATSVVTDLYLSVDATLTAADIFVGTVTAPTVPPGNTTVQATVTVPVGTPDADYFLLARVDAPTDWREINESDNDLVGPRFATAYEIQPTAISTAQAGINPGETATFTVQITNNGVPRVGALDIRVSASRDSILDANDSVILNTTVTLSGANVESAMVSGVLPNLAPGSYYAIVQVDPNDVIAETNNSNNIAVSAAPFSSGSDFTVGSIVIPVSVVPNTTAPITTTINSIAAPFTGNVSYRLWASTDQMVGGDTMLGMYTVAFAAQASRADAQNVLFPSSLPPNAYYVLAEIDPASAIVEVNEVNNTGSSVTVVLNGPDLRITTPTFTPNVLEVGAQVTVMGTLASSGVAVTANVSYGVYLSPNDMFDPGDVLVYTGSVFVAGVATTALTASFALPAVAPGTYTVFVVADPANATAEAIEGNNATAASGTLAVQGADLRVVIMTGEPVAFIGRTYQVSLTLENTGVVDARGFSYAYYLSEDEAIRIFDTQVFVSSTTTIASGAQQTFVDTVTLPTLTATATLFLGVLVDVTSRVPETNENNNIGRIPVALRIVFPIPDLSGQIVETTAQAAAGEQLAITRQVVNSGVADATAFEYAYYLSNNPLISSDDTEIGRFSLTLGEGEDDYGIDLMTLPTSVDEGSYYVGMIIDPDGAIEEVSEDNNTALGPQIPIFEAAIQFVTDRLPNAVAGVIYEIGVYAQGGPLPITWSISTGALPGGLAIDTNSGIISGIPTVEGLFEFTIRASSGTAYADEPFTIRVTAPTVDLEIATPSLPSAIAGREYIATLIAVGGNPPYTWEAISELPTGITLAEDGTLSGVPTTPGNLPITVSVRDAVNGSDSKALVLPVLNANQSVQITQVPLPKALVGLPYCEPETIRFEAQNGVPPYRWSLIGPVPAGMSMSTSGELCGTPEQAGQFPITVRAQDASGLFDTGLFIFEVSAGNELTISSFSLPDAVVGTDYAEKLGVARGMDPYTWNVVTGAGDLPPGLTLAEDGSISGTPASDGLFAFVVEVRDAQLRIDTQPLSIRVAPRPTTGGGDEGCGCTATQERDSFGFSSFVLALGLLALLRRRSAP